MTISIAAGGEDNTSRVKWGANRLRQSQLHFPDRWATSIEALMHIRIESAPYGDFKSTKPFLNSLQYFFYYTNCRKCDAVKGKTFQTEIASGPM